MPHAAAPSGATVAPATGGSGNGALPAALVAAVCRGGSSPLFVLLALLLAIAAAHADAAPSSADAAVSSAALASAPGTATGAGTSPAGGCPARQAGAGALPAAARPSRTRCPPGALSATPAFVLRGALALAAASISWISRARTAASLPRGS